MKKLERLLKLLDMDLKELKVMIQKNVIDQKDKDIKKIYKVCKIITNIYPEEKDNLKSILYNARITIDPNDDEDGCCSLINYILSTNKFNEEDIALLAMSDFLEDKAFLSLKEKLMKNKHLFQGFKKGSLDEYTLICLLAERSLTHLRKNGYLNDNLVLPQKNYHNSGRDGNASSR